MTTVRSPYSFTTPQPESPVEQHHREFWADFCHENLVKGNTEYVDESPFRIRAACQQTGQHTLLTYRQSGRDVSTRTVRHVRQDPDEDYRLICITGGSALITADEHAQPVTPGMAVLGTPAMPFGSAWTDTAGFIMRIPHQEINGRLGAKEPIWLTLDLLKGLGRVVVGMIRNLHEQRASLTEAEFDAVCERLSDLLCMVAAGDDRPAAHSLPEIESVVRRYVRQHAADRALSLPSVASGLGWSPRQLQAAMTRAGTTYRGVVRDERLRAARLMLQDPAHAHLPISDIALACGFASGKVLAVLFREQHGVSPRDFRYRALGRARP